MECIAVICVELLFKFSDRISINGKLNTRIVSSKTCKPVRRNTLRKTIDVKNYLSEVLHIFDADVSQGMRTFPMR